jgi:hypothetical protein
MVVKGLRSVVGVVAALSAMSFAMPALATGGRAPVVVHLKFRLVARGASTPSVSGRYVGFTQTTSTRQRTSAHFVLLDDRTGKRIVMSPNCDAGVVGAPLVALSCDSSQWYGLYNIRTRKLRRFPCKALCQQDYYYSNIWAVGVRWLEVQVEPHQSCGDGVHYSCGPTTYIYYNTRTGSPRFPSVRPSTIIDLNSPTLTRHICRPLVGPSLTLFGSFAVAEERGGVYVERCGSHLNLPLALAPYAGTLVGNTQAVAFCGVLSQHEAGMFLPSLRRFTFTLPSGLAGQCPVLGARHIYIDDAQERLWAAVFSSKPPVSQSTSAPYQAAVLAKRRPIRRRTAPAMCAHTSVSTPCQLVATVLSLLGT